jgi:hypothetical protein
MSRVRFKFVATAVTPFVFWLACSGGSSGHTPSTRIDQNESENVPMAGQFLADCPSSAAIVDAFVAASPLELPEGDVPTIGELLVSGDANDVPVIGGIAPTDLDPEQLESISAADAEDLLPAGGIPANVPALGAPVTCSDLPDLDPPTPTDAIGLIPVFDENGDVVAVVVAAVANPEDADVPNTVDLPDGVDVLPDPLPETIATLLALLPVPTETPSATNTPDTSPTPTETPSCVADLGVCSIDTDCCSSSCVALACAPAV